MEPPKEGIRYMIEPMELPAIRCGCRRPIAGLYEKYLQLTKEGIPAITRDEAIRNYIKTRPCNACGKGLESVNISRRRDEIKRADPNVTESEMNRMLQMETGYFIRTSDVEKRKEELKSANPEATDEELSKKLSETNFPAVTKEVVDKRREELKGIFTNTPPEEINKMIKDEFQEIPGYCPACIPRSEEENNELENLIHELTTKSNPPLSIEDALNFLGLKNPCCRESVMNPVKFSGQEVDWDVVSGLKQLSISTVRTPPPPLAVIDTMKVPKFGQRPIKPPSRPISFANVSQKFIVIDKPQIKEGKKLVSEFDIESKKIEEESGLVKEPEKCVSIPMPGSSRMMSLRNVGAGYQVPVLPRTFHVSDSKFKESEPIQRKAIR